MKNHRSALERAQDFVTKSAADPHRHAAPLSSEERHIFGKDGLAEIGKVFPDVVDKVSCEGGLAAKIPGASIDLADDPDDTDHPTVYFDALLDRVETDEGIPPEAEEDNGANDPEFDPDAMVQERWGNPPEEAKGHIEDRDGSQ